MVSVIVPVYNVEDYLADCIQSVLNQSFTDFELLLVDDGSTDRSGAVCDEYAKSDSRIKVFHKENGGVGSARNLALDNMQGEYCILLDSDDVIHPELLSFTVGLIEEQGTDAVIYNYCKVEETFTLSQISALPNSPVETLTRMQAMAEILTGKRFRMIAWNKLYRSSLWNDIRFPVERTYGDDSSVTYRLLNNCNTVTYTDNSLYYYRNRPDSALNKAVSTANLQLFDAYNELLSFYFSKLPTLSSLAAYAYVVRVFDFWSVLRRSRLTHSQSICLLRELRKKSKSQNTALLQCNAITVTQRLYLRVFFLSPCLFWLLYTCIH